MRNSCVKRTVGNRYRKFFHCCEIRLFNKVNISSLKNSHMYSIFLKKPCKLNFPNYFYNFQVENLCLLIYFKKYIKYITLAAHSTSTFPSSPASTVKCNKDKNRLHQPSGDSQPSLDQIMASAFRAPGVVSASPCAGAGRSFPPTFAILQAAHPSVPNVQGALAPLAIPPVTAADRHPRPGRGCKFCPAGQQSQPCDSHTPKPV